MPHSKKNPAIPRLGPHRTTPPSLFKAIPRQHLIDLFQKNGDKKLILIIGQAAQGKSTTAASWYFLDRQRPSAWLNLEPEDSDPINLFYLLIQAVHQNGKEKEYPALLNLPSLIAGPREGSSRYREWTRALLETFDHRQQLFFDGLDRLNPQAESYQFLQTLIEEIPASMRLILLSRAYPSLTLEFQELKVKNQVLLLKNEDLAFSPPEIKTYLRELHGLSLVDRQAERIHTATEGWIGGINLLAGTLALLPPASLERHLNQELPSRFQRDVFQYFGKEVFASLPPAQQDYLIRSSILDSLDPSVNRALFRRKDWEACLKELTRKNLFIQSFTNPKLGLTFRFHQLFRDFLGTLRQARLSAQEVEVLHSQAGDYYTRQGNPEKAIHHYLEAGAYPQAATLIKKIGLDLIKSARLGDLSRWLQALPQTFIQTDPHLRLYCILPNRYSLSDDSLKTLKEVIALFQQRGDRSGQFLGLAYLIEAEFTLGNYRPELIREGEVLLQTMQEDSCLYERAMLWTQIGLTQTVRGNPRRGYWACQKAYLLANGLADPLLQVIALSHAVTSLSTLGEFQPAERFLQEMNSLAWRFPQFEIRLFLQIAKTTYQIFHGEAEEAVEPCLTLQMETEKHGLVYLYPMALFYTFISMTYARRDRQADRMGQQLLNLAITFNNGFLAGAIHFLSGLSAYWSGRQDEARERIDRSIVLLEAPGSFSELHLNGARLARGLLHDGPGKRPGAIEDLLDLLQSLESVESRLFLTECCLALGLLYHDQGQGEQARRYLHQGLNSARRGDYRHFMIISPQDTVRACLLAQEYLPEDAGAEYAGRLVREKFGRQAVAELEALSRHPSPRVSRKAWEFRRIIHRSGRPE